MDNSAANYKIAIIGGGPAGSYSTLFLKKFARKMNKKMKKEQISKKEYELSDIFWDIFTGDRQYYVFIFAYNK